MSLLTGLLPVEQGVACLAALQAAATTAKADGKTRSKGQIMADTLVARLTCQETAENVGSRSDPAPTRCADRPRRPDRRRDPGLGCAAARAGPGADRQRPSPGLVAAAVHPTHPGPVGSRSSISTTAVAGSPAGWPTSSAGATGPAATRFCDAPIRHLDHLHRHHDGGPTTPVNGRGVGERGNYVRELPGWSVRLVDADTHTVITTTPPCTTTPADHPNRRDPRSWDRVCPTVTGCRRRRSPPPPWLICRIWDRSRTPSG